VAAEWLFFDQARAYQPRSLVSTAVVYFIPARPASAFDLRKPQAIERSVFNQHNIGVLVPYSAETLKPHFIPIQYLGALIGGRSWDSTLMYYRRVNDQVRDRLGGRHSADTLEHSY
jgi:hypothetical protein